MTQRKCIRILLASLGLLALILDGQTALTGAAEGISLCIRTVIPSLFPFLFLCGILTNALWGSSSRVLRPVGQLLGIPEGGESLLIAGFLGGYPAGAQAIGEAYRSGRLGKEDAAHLLKSCSNAGPAFLFGMVAAQFEETKTVWAIWGILILSALIAGIRWDRQPVKPCRLAGKEDSVSMVAARTVKAMALICGWILLFRVLLAFLQRWILWYFPQTVQILITGLLELSNGCCGLSAADDPSLRFLISTAILSFGGVCVSMQTAGVIGELSLKPYLWGKAAQTLVSVLLSLLYLRFGWAVLWTTGVILLIFGKLRKKEVDFRNNPVYNVTITTRRKEPCCFAKKSGAPAPTVSTAPGWRTAPSFAPKRD